MSGPSSACSRGTRTLSQLEDGETAIVQHLDVPDDVRVRLMEMGFLPRCPVTALRSAPGGDPRVFRVDGTEVALRRETARRIAIAPVPA